MSDPWKRGDDLGLCCERMELAADEIERLKADHLKQPKFHAQICAERDRYRTALKWYADSDNWKPGRSITSMGSHRASRGERDQGNTAREALNQEAVE